MFGMVTNVSIPNTSPVKHKQVLVQGVKHTDGITYTRCMEHMESNPISGRGCSQTCSRRRSLWWWWRSRRRSI